MLLVSAGQLIDHRSMQKQNTNEDHVGPPIYTSSAIRWITNVSLADYTNQKGL